MFGKKGAKKKILIAIMVGIIVVLAVTGAVTYNVYFKKSKPASTSNPSTSAPSGPSVPSRCSLVAKNDTYAKPDFERLKSVMENQPLVLDVPKAGKISLRFFHFTEGCRIYDKSYVISDGKITEGGGSDADIFVTLASSYVDRITQDNFCDIVKEARANDGLGQWTSEDVSEATLLWRYKGMLKYKECLGITLSG